MEEEARIERSKSKDALEEAMKDKRTLEGFDHETNLQLGLLQQQMKVKLESFSCHEYNNCHSGPKGNQTR